MARRSKSRAQIAREYGTTIRDIRPGETEEAYFKQLAKAADQRLLRLEELAKQEGFEPVMDYAYQGAMYNIQRMRNDPNAKRFNVALPKNKDGSINKAALHARINAVKQFLESPTSMKSGILKVYKRRADKMNKDMGTDFTWQELASYFEKERYAKEDLDAIASDVILKAVSRIRNIKKPEDIKKTANSNQKTTGDKVVDEVAEKLLKQGLTFDDFI